MLDAKRYLQQIRLYDSRISAKLEELQHTKEMALRVTPTLKNDAASGNGTQDKLAEAVAKMVDLETEINEDIGRYIAAKQEIGAVIDKLLDPDQFRVMHKRYVQHETWKQIAYDTGFSYRWVCTLHGRALREIEKILKSAQ